MARHIYGGMAPVLMGIEWTLCLLATLLVSLRLYQQCTYASRRTAWPLAWSLASWSFGIASIVSLTISVSYGLCMHMHELDKDQIRMALKWVWIGQAIQIFCYGMGKVAVVAFLLELQGPTYKKGRIFLHFLAATNIIFSIIEPLLVMLQCHPPEKLWDPEVPGYCKYGPGTVFGYFQGGWNAATDFYLALYPSFIIWQLQMPRRLKLGLCSLMALGFLMGACAIAKSVEIGVVERATDPINELYRLLSWAQTEMWVTIIIPCIPPLWPLLRRVFVGIKQRSCSHEQQSTSFGSSYQPDDVVFQRSYHASAKSYKYTPNSFHQLDSGRDTQEAAELSQNGILMHQSVDVREETSKIQQK